MAVLVEPSRSLAAGAVPSHGRAALLRVGQCCVWNRSYCSDGAHLSGRVCCDWVSSDLRVWCMWQHSLIPSVALHSAVSSPPALTSPLSRTRAGSPTCSRPVSSGEWYIHRMWATPIHPSCDLCLASICPQLAGISYGPRTFTALTERARSPSFPARPQQVHRHDHICRHHGP